MGADLYIHVYEGVVEEDIRILKSNTLGSKYCTFPVMPPYTWEQRSEVYDKMGNTPQVWIGEVSWLKAGLFEDDETFIPSTVEGVSELIGEDLPTLTEELLEEILSKFDLENKTSYRLNEKEVVEEFLKKHIGKKLFTVSW